MKRNVIIAVLLIALIALGFYFYDQNNKQVLAPSNETGTQTSEENTTPPPANPVTPPAAPTTTTPSASPSPTGGTSQGTYSDGSEAEGMAPDILVKEVVYDGRSYTPKSTNIKVGDIIIFRNNSDSDFWPASGPHPSHTNYPEFDPKVKIAAGGKWQFTFTKAGTWSFHDHLNPSASGTIVVAP